MKQLIDFKQIRHHLESVVQQAGYVKDKEKSTRLWAKYENPATGDKILLKDRNGAGQYQWYTNTDVNGDYGDVAMFVLRRLSGGVNVAARMEGAALLQVKDKLESYGVFSGAPRVITDQVRSDNKVLHFDLARYDTERVGERIPSWANRLLEQRGISINLARPDLRDSILILKSINKKLPNILFLWTDLSGTVKGGQYKYMDQGKCMKRFLAGTDREHSLWQTSTEGKSAVFVCEDPLDALAHKELFPEKNYAYVCTGGSLAFPQKDMIHELAQRSQLPLVLGMDNDLAGQRTMAKIMGMEPLPKDMDLCAAMEQVAQAALEQNIAIEAPPMNLGGDIVKDWNQLLNIKKKSPELNRLDAQIREEERPRRTVERPGVKL
ncbi:toprim domain-containing protein [Alistipes indistinctus]|uniref:toprim domain-containing protein n=1 Tax=Alistipes indistinctus TaxID=626932 RepID=UPI0015F226BF|nr:toprim domain-containing protein [Alistipes indistinctus]BCD55419.1 hypothetical protein AI2BBH_P170 [Alistipes indistinctus]